MASAASPAEGSQSWLPIAIDPTRYVADHRDTTATTEAMEPEALESTMTFTTYYLALGERTHRLIERLATHCVDPVDPDIGAVIVNHARHVLRAFPVASGRPGVRAGMYAAALAYCRDFMPRSDSGWEFIGAELTVGSCRADLAWRLPGAQIVLDELKIGVSELTAHRSTEYAMRLLDEARRALEGDVLGVRVIHLGGAAPSQLVLSDDDRRPLALANPSAYGPFN